MVCVHITEQVQLFEAELTGHPLIEGIYLGIYTVHR